MFLQEPSSFFFAAFVVGLGILSNYFLHRLDVKPLTIAVEENNSDHFIAERAYLNLKTLNDFGPKVVGSAANEILAFNFIVDKLSEIRNNSKLKDDIIIDTQVVSGSRSAALIYENLQNIIVRVQGEIDNALMMNCHFDSVPGSPGASDDIVMCCVMIEIFRIFANQDQKPKNSMVLLFNGAEEVGLLAAHGFVTNHPWAKDIGGYINLESTGSGGREVLFRSGPKHDWLIRLYRKSVPRPFGHAVAEELFETGVIPSATDFEIFRDFGNISGLDFAYVEAGWRYHTRYDSIDYITLESVQYTGDNILALTREMANCDEIADPPEGSFAIYFDYLGLFFISYSKEVGIGLNIAMSIIAVIIPMIIQTELKLSNVPSVLLETFVSFFTMLLSIVLSAAVCYLMAMIMNAADNTMSYFNVIFLSIGVYGSLSLLAQIATYHLVQFIRKKFSKKGDKDVEKQKKQMMIHLNGVNLFWAVLTITITSLGYRFAYITMVMLFVSFCTQMIIYGVCRILPKTRFHIWIFIHLLGHSFLFLWLCYMMIQVWELFIPITGKEYYPNPDITIALICTLWIVLCLSYFIPLTNLVNFRAILYSMIITTFLVSLIISFTSLGFPYSDNRSDPKLQRFRVIHTKRTVIDHNSGEETFSDIGYLLSVIDRNALRTLKSSFDDVELMDWDQDSKCEELTYCGFPLYRFNEGVYLKGTVPPTLKPTKLTLPNFTQNSSHIHVEFSLHLTTLTMIYVTPGEGWTFINGNIPSTERIWNGKIFQYTTLLFGKQTNEAWTRSFTLEAVPNIVDKSESPFSITVATIESNFEKVSEYVDVMAKFPEWTFAMEHQADVVVYKF